MEPGDYEFTGQIINKLKGSKVIIKAIPGLYEIFTGRVKMSSVYVTPLIVISHELIPVWQQTIKIFLDILDCFFYSTFSTSSCFSTSSELCHVPILKRYKKRGIDIFFVFLRNVPLSYVYFSADSGNDWCPPSDSSLI